MLLMLGAFAARSLFDSRAQPSTSTTNCRNRYTTMENFLIAGALTAFAVTSAFAQTTTVSSEYYVVRDATTKKCTIVDKKPTTTTTIVDNGIFKTRTEAETGMKTMKGLARRTKV